MNAVSEEIPMGQVDLQPVSRRCSFSGIPAGSVLKGPTGSALGGELTGKNQFDTPAMK